MELVSATEVTVEEDNGQGVASSVEICVQLMVEPRLPLDRAVVVILDAEDTTTGMIG